MNTLEISVQNAISFQNFVLRFYQKHGRHELPWRQTDDHYHILVSELMLQQTQVVRVIPKYESFMQRFPSIFTLAQANLSEVLTFWQGLGYNRRAKFLWQLAEKMQTLKQKSFLKLNQNYCNFLELVHTQHQQFSVLLTINQLLL